MNHKSLYKLTYGLYLLSANQNGRDNACIINTAVQVANDPARISIAVIKGGCTHDMVLATGVFNVTALTTGAPFSLFQHFGMQSGRNADKISGREDLARSANGCVYLTENAGAFLSCRVLEKADLGSHTLFIGEVTDGEVLSDGALCTYAYYQSDIKKKPAPAKKNGWVCSVCGYVYEGEEMPEDFLCPLCRHGKKDFVKQDAAPAPVKAESGASSGAKWVCSVCGYVHEGEEAPEACPVCKVSKDKFVKQGAEMTWAAEHIVGIANDAPEEIKEGLRANFMGECTEVGMYLAMARAAHREGFPEIGEYWKKAAYEEAEHAAKFAELLGEVVSDSTEKNLAVRVEAENGATAGKAELAVRARELNLDEIADTVFEMARDEARHGKAFEGLLKRYFGK